MIPNHWYAVLESRQIPAGGLIGATRMGEKLVFWRTADQVVCLRDLCAHRGAALSAGKVIEDHIQCPFHGLRYDGDGRCRLIPANGRQAEVPERFRVLPYTAREAHGFVWIWYGAPRQEYPPLPWPEDLDDTFTYTTIRDPWPVHYSRAIENQLDPVHVPFVHANNIGRGNRTLVNGPVASWRGDTMIIHTFNEKDQGQQPLKPQEIAPPYPDFRLEYYLPNIWQNRIADPVRVLAAFAPVDEENCLIYLRYYHRLTRVPLLRQFIAWTGKVFSRIVLRQDKRVVTTQRPKKTALRMAENLIQGDLPIIEFRRRRQELIDQAQEQQEA